MKLVVCRFSVTVYDRILPPACEGVRIGSSPIPSPGAAPSFCLPSCEEPGYADPGAPPEEGDVDGAAAPGGRGDDDPPVEGVRADSL